MTIEDTLRAVSHPGRKWETGANFTTPIYTSDPPQIELELAIRLVKEHDRKIADQLEKAEIWENPPSKTDEYDVSKHYHINVHSIIAELRK